MKNRLIAGLIALAALLLMVAILKAETLKSATVPPNSVVTLESSKVEPTVWLVFQPVDLQITDDLARVDESGAISAFVCLFNSGSAQTIVVVELRNGATFPDVTRHVITVSGDGPGPGPKPPKPPKPPVPPDDGKLADTTYDVGPAIARAWVGLGSDARSRVVRVFESAAVTAGVDGATAQQLYESIRTQLNAIGGVEYTPYLQAMQKSFTDKKVRTLREMSGAFAEIAAWVGGTN